MRGSHLLRDGRTEAVNDHNSLSRRRRLYLRDRSQRLLDGLAFNKVNAFFDFCGRPSPALDLLYHVFVVPATAIHQMDDPVVLSQSTSLDWCLGPRGQTHSATACNEHHILREGYARRTLSADPHCCCHRTFLFVSVAVPHHSRR